MTDVSAPIQAQSSAPERRARLYRMLWRWHFYAGLFCIPFIILLSITGSLSLFKPQIEAALDRPFTHLAINGPSAPVSQQVQIAISKVEGSTFKSYRLPDGPTYAAQVLVTKGGEDTIVYVHPTSLEILKAIP
ncbi:MAG: PepSY-associated TM helix domain-containing protein, partial [Hyphomonadaceae bacterium]